VIADREPRRPHKLRLYLYSAELAVCHLGPDAPIPAWATKGSFHSITRTAHELSIVCEFDAAPQDVECEGPWRCFEVEGPLDFSLTGVLVSLAVPLAEAGVSIFAVSSYLTDYVLVPAEQLEVAIDALSVAGHNVQ